LGDYGFAFSPKFIRMTKKGGEGNNRERGEGRGGKGNISYFIY